MTEIADNDISLALQQQVKDAIAASEPLFIHAGNSKHFYGNTVDAKPLDLRQHTGVVAYEPSELCITVRAGTRLSDLEKLLAQHQQLLPFEPPHYANEQAADSATIGGTIAAGISGPRRAYTGSARDAILGVQMINGEGEIVNFGGQVMKNVAGYDLSRLMVRSLGTLGVILNVSIRLLPKPSHQTTLVLAADLDHALTFFHGLDQQSLPITASAWHNDLAYLRLSASEQTIATSQQKMQLQTLDESNSFWPTIRDHQHPFFMDDDKPLWRLSLPASAANISSMDDQQLVEWGGAQRWVSSNIPANIIHSLAEKNGGHATLFRGSVAAIDKFPSLPATLLQLHKQLKNKMDPHGIFNPNRIYQGL